MCVSVCVSENEATLGDDLSTVLPSNLMPILFPLSVEL